MKKDKTGMKFAKKKLDNHQQTWLVFKIIRFKKFLNLISFQILANSKQKWSSSGIEF
jgi:hypothetical protein